MVVRRNKKVRKKRGSRTHGYGREGGHRKSGRRGGKGKTGKKGHEFIKALKAGRLYPRGFKPHRGPIREINTLNVGDLNSRIFKLVEQGKAVQSGDGYSIDLSEMDIEKLLGSGRVLDKINVKVEMITDKGKQKIEAAGGSVELLEEE